MKRSITLLMSLFLAIGTMWAQAEPEPVVGDVTSQYLKDADFASLAGWTKVADASFNDSGVGLIGAYTVRADVGTAATVDATHLATEYCLGLEFRWGAYVSYTQETAAELSSGIYTLTFDVENTNANTVADNYASMFFVQVGDTKYEDTAVEWKKGGATGWTTHTISFVVNSPAKATISLGIGAGGTNRGHAETPVIYVSHLKLEQTGGVQYATEEQKQALKDAIAEAGSHVLGFEVGEYAPYNNVDAAKALAAAQAIDVEVELAEVVAEALAALEAVVWTVNAEEMNAIYDGSFEYAYSTDGNVQPIAWHGINGHDNATDIRYMWNADQNAGLKATSTGKALFTKFNAFYGTEAGFTMPLKENAVYELTFIYGGWSDCQKDGYVTITGPNDEVIELSADRLLLDAVDGHQNTASWKTYTATFTTGAAGNYVLGLRKDRETEGKQSQYVYGDFKLYTAVPEKTDYTDAIKNADLSTTEAWDASETKGIKDGMVKVGGNTFNFCQTITLPAGQYKMTAKAAYRYANNTKPEEQYEYEAILAGKNTHLAKLYAETSSYKYEANVKNRWEGASDTDYAAGSGSVTVNGKFVPNSSAAVQAWFNNGQYVNELVFNVQEEGEVKIGIAKAENCPDGDYTNIGAWTLTRLGDAEADPEVEEPTPDPDPTPDPEKPEIGDVTSKYLVNADFETPSAQNGGAINTPPGWTMTYDLGGWLDASTRLSENPGNDASQCFNVWAGEFRNADIYQKPVLPAGKYKLTVGLYSDGDAERYAYATVGGNTIKSARPQHGSWDFVSVEFSNPTEGEVTMGAVSKGWFQIDNVKLEYLGEVGKDDFVNAYNQALGEAQALVGQKMSAAAAAQLEATIAEYGSLTADNSTDELEAATDAILAELVSVKASVNSYKVLAAGALPDNSLEGWTCTNSNTFHINTWSGEGNSDGTNMVTPFIENWVGKESLLGNGKISYTLPGVDPGYYKVSSLIRVYSEANNDITGASFFANEVKADFATGKPFTYNNMKGVYDVYTAVVNVGEEGILEFGVEIANATFNWVAFKNVKIEYIGVIDQAAAEVLKSKIPTTKYDAALAAEVAALVEAIDAGVTYENYLALSEKVALAESSAAAYAANKTAIDGMFTLLSSTNVYTVEAYNAYKAKAEDFLTQYDAGTLNATVDNPVAIHGWHASVDYDDLLLSAFGVKDFDDALHINTWSTEGEADGSEFKVPFYEYWTGDGESLGVATKTATVTGLTPGMYYAVEAWVRVRAKNGVAATDATGITLSVSNGEAVDLTEGEVVGTSQFSHAVYTAYGYADAEGNLTINFNVLEGNNVSWLSFKNVKYTEAKVDVAEVVLNETAIEFEELGVTFQLEATVTPVDATSPAVTWTSSDDAVTTVDENGLVTAVAVGTATITATADGVSATCAVTVTNIYDLSEVKDAFVAQAQEFMALAEGNMALYKLTALQTKCSEVMTLVNTLYEQIAGEEKVLKSSVVAAMEAMTTTKAEVEPVVAYYNEAYNTAWWDADDVLQSLDTDSEDYATLDAAIVAASDLSAVTTVAELEEKVAAINAAVAALYNLVETIEGEWEDVTNKPNEYGWTIIDHAELLGLGDYWVATNNTRYDEERGVMEFVAGENAAASLIQEWCPFGQATYRLTGKAFHNGAVNAVMFVGDQTVEIPAAAEGATFENAEEYFTTFSIEFTCESAWGTQLTVGYSCEFDNAEDFLVVGGLKLEEKKSTTIKSIFMETIMACESFGYEIMAMEALHADQQEVMAVAMPIYEAIMGDQKVLKSEVEQSIEDMQAIMAELNPVAEYYKGEFMNALYAAEEFKSTLDEASQAYTDLEAAINEAKDVAAVTTVAELEAKVAALEKLMELIETGIDSIEAEVETVIYDLSGRRVTEMTKGIYIVNGKKVLVK